jgi:hypothetical protein
MIAIETELRRSVRHDRKPGLTVRDQILQSPIRRGRRIEACQLARDPQPLSIQL